MTWSFRDASHIGHINRAVFRNWTSTNFTKEVGITPLGQARRTKGFEEGIPKPCRIETQTFAFPDLFFLFHAKKNSERRVLVASCVGGSPWNSRKKRNVGGSHSPAFGEADPELALAAQDAAAFEGAFEFDGDACVILTKRDDIQAIHRW